jgi:hypothetical protein
MNCSGNIYEVAMDALYAKPDGITPSKGQYLFWVAELREAAKSEVERSEFLLKAAKGLEESAYMPDLLSQLEAMALKRNTLFGGAPDGRGKSGYWTHLAHEGSDFDPYVSPVFGETEYESLKEAIAIELDTRKYASELNEFYE